MAVLECCGSRALERTECSNPLARSVLLCSSTDEISSSDTGFRRALERGLSLDIEIYTVVLTGVAVCVKLDPVLHTHTRLSAQMEASNVEAHWKDAPTYKLEPFKRTMICLIQLQTASLTCSVR
ncbi:hypothetical protein Q7C36_015443 [Tachysurus vachellii]|uniref:Uncharacterized protein n=1 Tax=Tachysurus vachellii TaxID=175792 RepID=A0AA88MD84_TACVA|nr:hypothetical protein Q7C36_015443 [Tachysurus vachellii]